MCGRGGEGHGGKGSGWEGGRGQGTATYSGMPDGSGKGGEGRVNGGGEGRGKGGGEGRGKEGDGRGNGGEGRGYGGGKHMPDGPSTPSPSFEPDALRAPIERVPLYLTQSVFKDDLQKSIPTQLRQLILYISNRKGYVDGFVGELTSATRL